MLLLVNHGVPPRCERVIDDNVTAEIAADDDGPRSIGLLFCRCATQMKLGAIEITNPDNDVRVGLDQRPALGRPVHPGAVERVEICQYPTTWLRMQLEMLTADALVSQVDVAPRVSPNQHVARRREDPSLTLRSDMQVHRVRGRRVTGGHGISPIREVNTPRVDLLGPGPSQ